MSRQQDSQARIRFGEELHQRLADTARENRVSLNREVVRRLTESFEPRQALDRNMLIAKVCRAVKMLAVLQASSDDNRAAEIQLVLVEILEALNG